jgi:hypothetical protein
MKIYTAGPLGFSEAGRAFHESIILPALRECGHEALDPWKLTSQAKIDAVKALPYGSERRDAWRKLNGEMGATIGLPLTVRRRIRRARRHGRR